MTYLKINLVGLYLVTCFEKISSHSSYKKCLVLNEIKIERSSWIVRIRKWSKWKEGIDVVVTIARKEPQNYFDDCYFSSCVKGYNYIIWNLYKYKIFFPQKFYSSAEVLYEKFRNSSASSYRWKGIRLVTMKCLHDGWLHRDNQSSLCTGKFSQTALTDIT